VTAAGPLANGIRLVHVDGQLLVVEKPSGLLCQPGLGPQLADSLLTRLRERWPTAQLVHRLDRDTSGLLLLALAPELHRALSRLFAQRQVRKLYQAEVEGVPEREGGTIELAIAKLRHRPPLYGVDPAGRPSRTHWRRLQPAPDGRSCRLELRPHTGRSHQLRVHLQAIGHPILGDPLYGSSGGGRLRLHAAALAFEDPRSAELRQFHSPCPF
jgi:tRNA pseudouridine32 synthase/23S rRNA pseudouridine746 synthase